MGDGYKYGAKRPQYDESEKTFVQGFPLFQWANGWKTKDRRIAAGWVSQAGKFGDDFDAAMKSAGYATFQTTQNDTLNTYWLVEGMDMFVVCQGLSGSKRMEADPHRDGIGYGIHSLGFFPNGKENKDGKLQAVVFPTKLAEAGYLKPCLITGRRMTAIKMIYAMTQHFKALDWLFEYAKGNSKTPDDIEYPAYYAVAVSIVPGDEESYVGHDGQQSTNIPPVPGLPEKFGEDKKAAVAYIQQRLIRRKDNAFVGVLKAIEDPNEDSGLTLMDEVLSWAQEFSDRWTRDGDPFKANGNSNRAPAAAASPSGPSRGYAAPTPAARNAPVVDEPDEDLPF